MSLFSMTKLENMIYTLQSTIALVSYIPIDTTGVLVLFVVLFFSRLQS